MRLNPFDINDDPKWLVLIKGLVIFGCALSLIVFGAWKLTT